MATKLGYPHFNETQLITRRKKLHWSHISAPSWEWRKEWRASSEKAVMGKKRAYDHLVLGLSLAHALPHPFFVNLAFKPYCLSRLACTGWATTEQDPGSKVFWGKTGHRWQNPKNGE